MTFAKHFLIGTGTVVMATGAVLFAQGTDAAKVMADMRQALGGDAKLAAVKTLTATGKNARAMGETSMVGEYELGLELPGKFFTKSAMAQTPMGPVILTSGFNGDDLIQDTEMPSAMHGAQMMIRPSGSSGPNATPEQKAADQKRIVLTSKQEFARLTLGMFGASFGGYPLTFKHAGTAEAPDGKADIIEVTGAGDFAGKLFVDQKSHLPLMFSWMAKEPMVMSMGPGGARVGGGNTVTMGGGGGGMQTFRSGGPGSSPMTPEERDKLMKDADARIKEAEANRKTVEYRVFYGDYQTVDGVKLPHKFSTSIAGAPSSELTIEKFKVNPKIDPKRFEPVKPEPVK